jgi:hypothetical protein
MTTLGWAVAWHLDQGSRPFPGAILVVLGALFDLGILRTGRRRMRGGGDRGDPPQDGGQGGGGAGGGGGRAKEIVIEAERVG